MSSFGFYIWVLHLKAAAVENPWPTTPVTVCVENCSNTKNHVTQCGFVWKKKEMKRRELMRCTNVRNSLVGFAYIPNLIYLSL